jgi:hypothetical protein
MRKITNGSEGWMALAQERGRQRQGEVALGRFHVEETPNGQLRLTFLTPVVAGTYSEELQRKTPPILFDRTPEGQIIVPGRWWQAMFERGRIEHPEERFSAPPRGTRRRLIAAERTRSRCASRTRTAYVTTRRRRPNGPR